MVIKLKESKKRNTVSKRKPIRESKHRRLTEGPGAGYTIDWTLDNIYSVNADGVSVFLNRQEYSGASHRGSLLISCNVKCKAKCSVTIDSASSYYYGIPNSIENVDAMITAIYIPIVDESYKYEVVSDGGEYVVVVSKVWYERKFAGTEISRHESLNEAYDKILQLVEKEVSDNINNESYFYDLITDLANSEGRKFSYTYGGGWSHSTYDGTLSAIDEKRYDYIDAELLDADIIKFIDEAVQGENYWEYYKVTFNGGWDESYDTKDELKSELSNMNPDELDEIDSVYLSREYYDENEEPIDVIDYKELNIDDFI